MCFAAVNGLSVAVQHTSTDINVYDSFLGIIIFKWIFQSQAPMYFPSKDKKDAPHPLLMPYSLMPSYGDPETPDEKYMLSYFPHPLVK